MTKKTTREKLLDAAEDVAAQKGIANITLDAVAKKSGLSKGGLLHHFPSKDKLISAMVQRSADDWRSCYNHAYEAAEPGPGRMVRGLIQQCLNNADSWNEERRKGSSTIFAALAQNPELVAPMREAYQELYDKLEDDGLPAGVSEAAISAIDGLWLNWVLGISTGDKARTKRVCLALRELLRKSEL